MTHILLFRQLFSSVFTLHLSNSHFSHETVSNSGNTKKEKRQVCAKHLLDKATACTSPYATMAENKNYHTQGLFCIKPMCNAAQKQMFLFILAGQTTGLLGLRVCFMDYLIFKIRNFSQLNIY